eukprot:1694746-Rhodomonas_salina.4
MFVPVPGSRWLYCLQSAGTVAVQQSRLRGVTAVTLSVPAGSHNSPVTCIDFHWQQHSPSQRRTEPGPGPGLNLNGEAHTVRVRTQSQSSAVRVRV